MFLSCISTESVTFSSPLTVNGDITTSSTVDNIDVPDLDTDTVRVTGGKTVSGKEAQLNFNLFSTGTVWTLYKVYGGFRISYGTG